jgi:hypothetical protein
LQFTAVFLVAQTCTCTPLTIRAAHIRGPKVLATTDHLE